MKITITVEDDAGEVQTYRVGTVEEDSGSENSRQSRSATRPDEPDVEIYDAGTAPPYSNGRTSHFESRSSEFDEIDAGSFR